MAASSRKPACWPGWRRGLRQTAGRRHGAGGAGAEQRSQGRSAIAAAAYRAAAALHDESLGRTFNYLAKSGLVHSEILLPEGAPARWLDRAALWNEVERVERRRDAVLAREIELALPRELSEREAIRLARDFAREQFVARGMVADLNVHWGRSSDGEAQPHAHIMLSMRRVVPGQGHPEEAGFGLKERGWNDKALLRMWRARWAELVNVRLAEADLDIRVDHRANVARGIDLEPQNKVGPAGARRAVRGEDAERAEEHRAIARRNGERLLAAPELALQALTQQQSTFTRADLAKLVHRHSDGAAQFTSIMAKVEASPELLHVGADGHGRPRFSTREMVAIEAGAAFRAIAERVGAVEITEVRRQRIEWQRDATRELATGQTGTALARYQDAGMVHAHATDAAARAALIAGWQTARRQVGENQIILAHTRDDVRALNEAARALRRDAGELGEDKLLPTELGPQSFAVGDRIYFLRNERGLGGPGRPGVKNGTLGTVVAIDGAGEHAKLAVRLDREDPTSGEAAVVVFGLAEYAHIDHGYAATIHKAQSVTVERAHVLATPGMDRHLAYVALTRHRHDVALHWSGESFGSAERLAARLGRERAKDTTLDYGESEDELCAVYAERRGLNPLAPASEIVVGPQVPEAGQARRNLERARLARELPLLVELQQAFERQRAALARIGAALERRAAPSEDAAAGRAPGMFDGLRLNAASPPPIAEPTRLEQAVAGYLDAARDAARMQAAALPLLAHQAAARDAACQQIDALRPGFAADLAVAIGRQPELAAHGADGVAAAISAAERVATDRQAEARRQAEHAALAPVRARLVQERMEAWWRENYPVNRPWDRSNAMREHGRPFEEKMRREIEAMPHAELRRIEAAWAAQPPKPDIAPAPRRRLGPSPW